LQIKPMLDLWGALGLIDVEDMGEKVRKRGE
jgi:hypothetical protein